MPRRFCFLVLPVCVFWLVFPVLAAQPLVRVACLGDSITYGYNLHNKQDAYPGRLGRWLGNGYDVRNFGVSATTLITHGDYPYVRQPAYGRALEFKLTLSPAAYLEGRHYGRGIL